MLMGLMSSIRAALLLFVLLATAAPLNTTDSIIRNSPRSNSEGCKIQGYSNGICTDYVLETHWDEAPESPTCYNAEQGFISWNWIGNQCEIFKISCTFYSSTDCKLGTEVDTTAVLTGWEAGWDGKGIASSDTSMNVGDGWCPTVKYAPILGYNCEGTGLSLPYCTWPGC